MPRWWNWLTGQEQSGSGADVAAELETPVVSKRRQPRIKCATTSSYNPEEWPLMMSSQQTLKEKLVDWPLAVDNPYALKEKLVDEAGRLYDDEVLLEVKRTAAHPKSSGGLGFVTLASNRLLFLQKPRKGYLPLQLELRDEHLLYANADDDQLLAEGWEAEGIVFAKELERRCSQDWQHFKLVVEQFWHSGYEYIRNYPESDFKFESETVWRFWIQRSRGAGDWDWTSADGQGVTTEEVVEWLLPVAVEAVISAWGKPDWLYSHKHYSEPLSRLVADRKESEYRLARMEKGE